jgi:hypothetical protein
MKCRSKQNIRWHLLALSAGLGLAILPWTARTSAQDAKPNSISGASSDAPPHRAVAPAADHVPMPAPWSQRPYQVRLIVSVDDQVPVPAELIRRWTNEASTLLIASFRQMWMLNSEVAPDRLTFDEFSAWDFNSAWTARPAPEADKVFRVLLEIKPGRLQIFCRELDDATRTMGGIFQTTSADWRTVPSDMAQLATDAFRPLVEVDADEENRVNGFIRAGEFPPADPEAAQFQPGDWLMPVLRYSDRNRQVRSVQPIAWTFFKVEEVDRGRTGLSVISAYRRPLPTTRRRVELLGIRVRPHLDSTTVLVLPRGNRQNPLAGASCELMNRNPGKNDPVTERLKLSTDRRGMVSVPADPAHPLRYLQIYSGEALLARVPIMPGLAPFLELEVPDDRARLNVEGEVQLLEVELVDIVATREVLMTRTRAAAEQNRIEDVDRFLQELRMLPTLKQYLKRIDTLRIQAVYAAQQAQDRVAENRIKRLCTGITEMATKHLDPQRLADFEDEISSLKLKK